MVNNPFQWTDPTGYAPGYESKLLDSICRPGSPCTSGGVDVDWAKMAANDMQEAQKNASSPTGAKEKQVTGAQNQNTTDGKGANSKGANFDSKDLVGNFVLEKNWVSAGLIQNYFGNEEPTMLSGKKKELRRKGF